MCRHEANAPPSIHTHNKPHAHIHTLSKLAYTLTHTQTQEHTHSHTLHGLSAVYRVTDVKFSNQLMYVIAIGGAVYYR